MKWQKEGSGQEWAKDGGVEVSVSEAPCGWLWRVEGCEPKEGGAKQEAVDTVTARLFRHRVLFALDLVGPWCDDEVIERIRERTGAQLAESIEVHRLLDRLGVPAGDLLTRIAKLAAR